MAEAKKGKKKKVPTRKDEINQRAKLIGVLNSLEHQIGRQTSLKFAFLRGVIYGLGTVIGATVLIALLSGLLGMTVESLEEMPFVGDFFSPEQTESLLR